MFSRQHRNIAMIEALTRESVRYDHGQRYCYHRIGGITSVEDATLPKVGGHVQQALWCVTKTNLSLEYLVDILQRYAGMSVSGAHNIIIHYSAHQESFPCAVGLSTGA